MTPRSRSPWVFVPTLYFAEGVPYVLVNSVSVVLYKRLGISNTEIALYTSWLYLPWVMKPLWSPLVELFKTKRFWILLMQLLSLLVLVFLGRLKRFQLLKRRRNAGIQGRPACCTRLAIPPLKGYFSSIVSVPIESA